MHRFRRLKVWQRAFDLADAAYDATETFPREEVFGLQSQIRRAAVSISSNIAEGAATDTPRAFARYLRIAYGSAGELENQIALAERRGLIDRETSTALLDEVDQIRRMLYTLIGKAR